MQALLQAQHLNRRQPISRQIVAWALIWGITASGPASSIASANPFSGTFTFGSGGNVTSFPFNGTPIPNLTVSDLTKVGVTTSSSTGNFRASNWALDPVVGTLGGTVDLSKYYQFTLTAAAGYTFNMTDFNFGVGRSGTGPRSFQWRSTVDAYGAPIAGYTTVNSGLNQTLGTGILTYTTDSSTSATGNVLGFSAPAYQALPSVTFRFYGYNSEGTGGTGGLDGNFAFNGTLNAPVGTTYTWTGTGGGGTWENGQQGSFNASYANSGISVTEFAGTGETVNVAEAGVQVGQLKFLTSGYFLAGGPISLGLGTVTADPATTTTITAPLTGSAGLTKNGGGLLVLAGTNTYTGATTVSAGTLQIAADSALGDAANDLVIGGTLKTTASASLSAGRDLSGAGVLDIAPGTVLTVNGATNMSSLTLSNTGSLAFANVASNPGNITTTPTSGTVTLSGAIAFSASDKVVTVPAGGTLALTGAITLATATGTELTKDGAGLLVLSGAGSSISRIQLGRSGTTPSNGGTLRVTTAADLGAQEMYFNYGTIEPTATITTSVGASLSGRAGSELVIGGTGGNADLTMGSPRLFGATGSTAGDIVLKVNNNTTFTGAMSNSTTSLVTGLTVGGTGRLTLAGPSSAMTSPISLTDSVTLSVTGAVGGSITAGGTNVLVGTGTIGGAIGGAGSVQPGTGTGILTAGQINPVAGTDFVFQYTGALPDYAAATASGNDVARVTAATPFPASMTSANTLDLFLGVTSMVAGDAFEGGFFTDTATDFTAAISGATTNYYVLGNGAGTDATLAGQGYYSFANWKTASGADPALSLSLSTIARTATFVTTPVNGQAMVVSAVPEPGTLGLAAAALVAAAGYATRRRLGR
jgi:autotransporter-associated beta strand protein